MLVLCLIGGLEADVSVAIRRVCFGRSVLSSGRDGRTSFVENAFVGGVEAGNRAASLSARTLYTETSNFLRSDVRNGVDSRTEVIATVSHWKILAYGRSFSSRVVTFRID